MKTVRPVTPDAVSPLPSASAGPLSDQHLSELAAAKLASRRLRRTASVARASAWTTGVLAGITLLGVVFGDLVSLVLGAGLMIVAIRSPAASRCSTPARRAHWPSTS